MPEDRIRDTEKKLSLERNVTEQFRLQEEFLKTIKKLEAEHAEEVKKEIAYEENRQKILKENQDIIESEIDTQEKKIENEEIHHKSLQEQVKTRLAQLDLDKKKNEENGDFYFSEQNYLTTKKNLLQELEKAENLTKKIEQQKESLDIRKESLAAIKDLRGETKNIIGNLTGIGDEWKKTFFGKIALSSREVGGLSAALKNIGRGVKETITPSNLLGSSLMKMQEASIYLAIAQDQVVSDFNRSAGAAGEYDQVIKELGRENLELGIDTQEVASAISSLRETFLGFTELSRTAQKEISLLSATMNKFGVDSQVTAQNLQIATAQLGMSTQEAIEAQKEIAATAVALGRAPAQMAEDFTRAAPRLAAFGDKAVDVFRNLAATAKAARIDVDSLLDITEQFDTFEGAAQAVGSLNAVLGGPFIDSMQMVMTTDPTERIKLLRGAVDSAGVSFNSLSFYQKKALASAAGIQDVGKMAQLMSQDLDSMSEAARRDALSKEEMAKMSQKALGIMEKLKNMAMAFAIALDPVVNMVRSLLDGVLNLNKWMGGYLIPTFVGVLGIIKLLSFAGLKSIVVSKLVASSKIAEAIAHKLSAKAKKDEVNISKKSTATMMASIPVLLAFGAAVVLVGAGVFLASKGIASMAEALKGMSPDELITLIAIFSIMAIGIAALATVSVAAALPLLALGGAVLMIGGGIALVGLGISMMADALKSIATDKVISGLSGVATSIKEIAYAMTELPLLKTISFAGFVTSIKGSGDGFEAMATASGGLKQLVEVASEVETTAVENTKRLVDQSIRYKSAHEEKKTSVFDPIIELLSSAVGAEAKTAAAPTKATSKQPIILQLEGRTLKKFVVDVLNTEMNPRRI